MTGRILTGMGRASLIGSMGAAHLRQRLHNGKQVPLRVVLCGKRGGLDRREAPEARGDPQHIGRHRACHTPLGTGGQEPP